MKRITLCVDSEVADMAKKIAKARGMSVSAMFSKWIRSMAENQLRRARRIGPITRRLTGIAMSSRKVTDLQLIEESLQQKFPR